MITGQATVHSIAPAMTTMPMSSSSAAVASITGILPEQGSWDDARRSS